MILRALFESRKHIDMKAVKLLLFSLICLMAVFVNAQSQGIRTSLGIPPAGTGGIPSTLWPTFGHTSPFFRGITCGVFPYLPPVPRADARGFPQSPILRRHFMPPCKGLIKSHLSEVVFPSESAGNTARYRFPSQCEH